jgi:Putative Flp pilus-assembly TadE/G-like
MPSNDSRLGAFRRYLRHEGGQVLPLTALMMVVLVGFGALVVDVGRIYFAQRQLQNAVDASALSAAQNMPDVYKGFNTVPSFDGIAPSKNALFGYGVTAADPVVTYSCSPNAPGYDPNTDSCPADASPEDQPDNLCNPGQVTDPAPPTNGCNAVTVSEQANVKSTLAGIFGFSGFNITANATASAPQSGSAPTPLNVEVILDTTPSMGGPPDGRPCQSAVTGINRPRVPYGIDCAKAGVRALLSGLSPCNGTCTGNIPNLGNALGANVTDPLDEVGLVTFPALSNVANRPVEIDCIDHNFANNYVQYPTPYPPPTQPQPGYDVIGLSSDYKTSDDPTAPLNPTSNLVQSVYWSQCPGGNYPGGPYYGLKDVGQQSTYLAGALAEAQYQLAHAPARATGAAPVNVIIVLSDGQLNQVNFANNGHDNNPCQSAFNAAAAAKGTGTLIFSIAYDSTLNCTDNTGTYHNVPGKTLMQNIATPGTATQQYFYDQPAYGDLTDIFTQISQTLAQINTRLIPNP